MVEPDEITRELDEILGLPADDAEAGMAFPDGYGEPDEGDEDDDDLDDDFGDEFED
jgi:hypothetical protein